MQQTDIQQRPDRRHLELLNIYAKPILPIGVIGDRRRQEVAEILRSVRVSVQRTEKGTAKGVNRLFLLWMVVIGLGFAVLMFIAQQARQPHLGKIASIPYAFERAIYEWFGWHRLMPHRR